MKQDLPLLLSGLLILSGCYWPIENGASRETPLHFGMYVTPDPAQNPIDPPERFTGWHTGTDFEIRENEKNVDVDVFAVCGGKVRFSGFAAGYGGVVAQECMLKDEPVNVIYGHLAVANLPTEGVVLTQGQKIGVLGADRSTDADGSRKHLHLTIHKGKELVMLGYVQTEAELKDFIDPQTVLPWPREK